MTLSRGLYTRQGTTHNGHQRATWYCLQSSSTTQLAVPRLYPVDDGQDFPLLSSFSMQRPGRASGRYRRELRLLRILCMKGSDGAPSHRRRGLRPTTGPMLRRLRRSLSSRNRRGDRHTRSSLHRRPDGALCGALLSRYCSLDVNIFICQLLRTIH